MNKAAIVSAVERETAWWINERVKKLDELNHDSMAVNPFLTPLLFNLNGFDNFSELAGFLIGGHFSTGHATGFGKLIDEKILPNVFGTNKLHKKFRETAPYNHSIFDEIDHIVTIDKKIYLMSLKAGRWTIQLTMAVQLNKAFCELLELKHKGSINFDKIVVGVFYGKNETLTDKYDILRGINRGANHSVTDITGDVEVYAGRKFWSWLNSGEDQTQDWVLDGILQGIEIAKKRYGSMKPKIDAFKASFNQLYQKHLKANGDVDWHALLKDVNG